MVHPFHVCRALMLMFACITRLFADTDLHAPDQHCVPCTVCFNPSLGSKLPYLNVELSVCFWGCSVLTEQDSARAVQ